MPLNMWLLNQFSAYALRKLKITLFLCTTESPICNLRLHGVRLGPTEVSRCVHRGLAIILQSFCNLDA